ncbi:GNAT family N-acetyltransferase [Rhizobium rhizoryzae]|uniref:Diamine N-acetyltransferase n=1 Tax=Rhizobium rhizoryzae TaxID=451876 RepID=A0A7W6LCK1_9HYPH|nr:GNAT family N-acetyltransferase [Rhizobium rhizoryzae]MBB4141916.1 diamine N-acetyltransferase [Rhizobium rhizoryzae]
MPFEPPIIQLCPVTAHLVPKLLDLRLRPDQVRMVASVADSLEEAETDEDARPRAILHDGEPVGFLMYDATSADDVAQLYRFIIDERQQGRGFGRAALSAVIAEIRREPHVLKISICYEPENLAARQLYLSAGFVEQGLDEDGEMIAHLALPPSF